MRTTSSSTKSVTSRSRPPRPSTRASTYESRNFAGRASAIASPVFASYATNAATRASRTPRATAPKTLAPGNGGAPRAENRNSACWWEAATQYASAIDASAYATTCSARNPKSPHGEYREHDSTSSAESRIAKSRIRSAALRLPSSRHLPTTSHAANGTSVVEPMTSQCGRKRPENAAPTLLRRSDRKTASGPWYRRSRYASPCMNAQTQTAADTAAAAPAIAAGARSVAGTGRSPRSDAKTAPHAKSGRNCTAAADCVHSTPYTAAAA